MEDTGLGQRGAVLDQHPGADGELALGQPADGGGQLADGAGGASVAARMSPRDTSMSVSSRITTDCPATARSSGPSGVSIASTTV